MLVGWFLCLFQGCFVSLFICCGGGGEGGVGAAGDSAAAGVPLLAFCC